MDPRLQKMADVLVNYSVEVKPKDWVCIQTSPLGEPLADACVEAVLKAGGNPTVILASGPARETMLRLANDEQLQFVPPSLKVMIEQADVLINILAPINTRAYSNVDPSRMAVQNKAMQPMQQTLLQRSHGGEMRTTIAAYPTQAAAQDAGMSLRDYEDFVFGAGLLQESNPVGAWKNLSTRQQHLVDWLADKSEVHIVGPGTDLTLNVAGRTWINEDAHDNFPGGEVYTGPVESSTEGTIEFNFPAVYQGREINGIRLTFKHGEVVDASASADEAYLHEMLAMDGGAKHLGEFAFGTNFGIQRFSKSTLFDEKIGGTLHMALGASIPGTGGVNESALHWDIVYDLRRGAEVTVDGQAFSRNGELCV